MMFNKKLLLLSTFCLVVGISNSYADGGSKRFGKSPESIVGCANAHVRTWSISTAVDQSQCVCNPLCVGCIESLENQGCRIVDTTVANNSTAVTSDGGQTTIVDWDEIVTYLLSCSKP